MQKEILVSVHSRRLGISRDGGLILDGEQIAPTVNPTGAMDYFVDGNRLAAGAGTSWGTAYDTLAEAITASNLSIASSANRWWARRNRIFVCGDQEINEDLTILPEKCDIIGVGYDVEAMPMIIGNHDIAAVATGKARGTRFINCGFIDETGATPVFTFGDGMLGLGFYGCLFWPFITGGTIAISLETGNPHFRFINSEIRGNVGGPALFAEGIKINGTTQQDFLIEDSKIYATEGIHIHAGTGTYNSYIMRNFIRAAALCVNDVAGLTVGVDNRMITDANTGADALLGVVATKSLWSGNKLTGIAGTEENADYPFPVQFTS